MKLPAGHVDPHAAAPAAETLPLLHATHEFVEEPVAADAVPAAHSVHALAPVEVA